MDRVEEGTGGTCHNDAGPVGGREKGVGKVEEGDWRDVPQ